MVSDFFSYLEKDTVLAGLLGGTVKLYRDCAPKDTAAPYLVYGISSDGTEEELLGEISIRVSVYSASAELADKLCARLKAMLDLQDQIGIPSATYRIRWCKQLAGSSIFEQDTRLYNRALVFTFKFTED
jgi:hypothetical protein